MKTNSRRFRIGTDFVSQILDNISSQTELAEKLQVSKGAVSQVLNTPGNLTFETMIKYADAIGMKATIVLYDKNNKDRPIHPNIFRRCWERFGSPRDFWALEELSAITSDTGRLEKKDGSLTYKVESNGNTMPMSMGSITVNTTVNMPLNITQQKSTEGDS